VQRGMGRDRTRNAPGRACVGVGVQLGGELPVALSTATEGMLSAGRAGPPLGTLPN
jgi:hypothetical protein